MAKASKNGEAVPERKQVPSGRVVLVESDGPNVDSSDEEMIDAEKAANATKVRVYQDIHSHLLTARRRGSARRRVRSGRRMPKVRPKTQSKSRRVAPRKAPSTTMSSLKHRRASGPRRTTRRSSRERWSRMGMVPA